MKKLTIISAFLFLLFSVDLIAQETDTDVVEFTAILSSVLNLTVTDGESQTVTFDTPDKYNFGVDTDGIGNTTITIESTSDWDLKINAADFSDGGGNTIPIDNLGVYCTSEGLNQIGAEVSCANTTPASAMGLTVADQVLLDVGTGESNSGDAALNAFTLYWEMGTMNGTMNDRSIFAQLSDGTIGSLGTYTTTVNLTLTAK